MGKKLAIILRFLLLISLFLSIHASHIHAAFSRNIEDGEKIKTEKKSSKVNEILKIPNLMKTETIVILEDQIYLIKPKGKVENEIFRKRFEEDKSCLAEKRREIFRKLKKAEEYLKCLLKEREILVEDFWGINITAYRYVNIFDRRNYIRYRIMQVDKKIKKTKLKICELRKKLDDLAKSSSKK